MQITADPFNAAASLINGFMNNRAQKRANETNLQIARETNQQQLDMMREQNQFNAEQAQIAFDRENSYNAPVQQLKRMRDAGLNPYSGSAAGQQIAANNAGESASAQSSGIPDLKLAQVQAPPAVLGTAFSNFATMAGAMKSVAEAKKTGIDTDLLQQTFDDLVKQQSNQTALQEMQLALNQVDLDWLPKKYSQDIEHTKQAIATAFQQARMYCSQAENLAYDSFLKYAQEQLAKWNCKLTQREIKRIDDMLPYDQKLATAQANQANANAEQSHEIAQTERDVREHVVEKAKQEAKLAKQEYRVKLFQNYITSQNLDTLVQRVKSELNLTDQQANQLREAARKAKREGNWMWFDKIVGNIIGKVGDVAGTVALAAILGA